MRSLVQDLNVERLRPALKPEERLLLAVVESAFWDLQSPDPARRQTARSYFLDERGEHTFSFLSICEHFSWSPISIRGSLRTKLTIPSPEAVALQARTLIPKATAARR
jgi:hypothetical protein